MLRAALCALVLVLLGALASADPVRTIERSAGRLARTPLAGRDVTVFSNGKLTVWVRPGSGVIGVQKAGLLPSSRGFTLSGGRLSAQDRATLESLLARHAPGASAAAVKHTLAKSLRELRRRERRLEREDGAVQGILGRVRALRGAGGPDAVVWEGRRGRLIFRPSANVLVGEGRLSQRAFFPDDAASMRELREFLVERR